VFDATAKQYVGIIKFAKLDTESDPALAQGLGVQALPTILMFYKGQLVNAVEGALPASAFQQWLYQTLAAIRQYQNQLDTEAEAAIASAVQNLTLLDNAAPEGTPGEQAGADEMASGASPAASAPPPPPPNNPQPPERGKRTASGLYIP
jgi:thioredoxin-like negative regulator of GroEL